MLSKARKVTTIILSIWMMASSGLDITVRIPNSIVKIGANWNEAKTTSILNNGIKMEIDNFTISIKS